MENSVRRLSSKVLVTGANGFIGSALVRRLVDQGTEVNCLVYHRKHRLAGLPVTLFQGDVTRPETLGPALSGVNVVYHLGALASDWGPREMFFRINTDGTRNVIEEAVAVGVNRVVYVSSLAVHRFIGHLDAEETTPADQLRYAYSASKAAAEQIVIEAHQHSRIQTGIVRPGVVVYGPEDTTAFIHMAPMLAKGRWIHVNGGHSYMCCVHVQNLVDGIILVGTHDEAAGEVFNITDDIKLTWRHFISKVITAFGVQERVLSIPAPAARAVGISLEALYRLVRSKTPPPINDYRSGLLCKHFHFVCEKAKHRLGYHPRADLDEGLAAMVSWYRQTIGHASADGLNSNL